MTLATTSFAIIADTIAERDSLNTLFPSLVEGTMCYTAEDNKTHKKTLGVWVQYQPDSAMQASIDNLYTGKANTVHTHVINDITDTSTLGKTLMTVTDSASARTAIGAGTSSFDGNYASLSGKPSLATVATSGSYNDLSSKPTIPAAPVNADWNAGSGLAQILNKPSIPVFNGTTSQYVRGDGTFATFPSIPSSQVQSDWNATSGLGQILNKPAKIATVAAVTGSTTTAVVDILGIQVATGAAITTLGATVGEIKARLNEFISGTKTVGLMA